MSIKVEEIDEQLISDNLFYKRYSDPDLLIRTSGEQRISNFYFGKLLIVNLYLQKWHGRIL